MTIQNISIIPYARSREIEFFGVNLRPERNARIFLDDVSVDNFVQNASLIESNASVITSFVGGEGVFSASSNAYATVVKSVSGKGLYVNDNYISLRVSPHGANTLQSGSFVRGDFVFQNENNVYDEFENTFSGRVEHWDLPTRTLIIAPANGTVSNASNQRIIFTTLSPSPLANCHSTVIRNKFLPGSIVVSTENPANNFTVVSYEHNHGIITNTNSETNKINLSSNVTSTVVGKQLRLTGGTGLNQVRQITALESNNVVALNAAVSFVTGNTRYSIGEPLVDEFGNIAGIFNLPETNQFKFRAGERIFTITDTGNVFDRDATMRASGRYSSSGLEVESIQPTPPFIPIVEEPPGDGTPVVDPVDPPDDPGTQPGQPPDPRPFEPIIDGNFFLDFGFQLRFDPIAQTFYTPKPVAGSGNRGVFISSVDIFFKKKPGIDSDDTEVPAIVRIVETLNGFPTTRVIAETSVPCVDVKISDGITKFPNVNDPSTITNFRFRDPVYLAPSTEYALIVYSDTPTYEVWIAELGESIIGDPDGRRVSEQPYIGSFFRSQNASTWTPYQNQDLMFRINQAVFSTSPVNLAFSVEKQSKDVPFDNIILNSKQLSFPVTSLRYDMKTTIFGTLERDGDFLEVDPNITYSFAPVSNTSIKIDGKRRIVRRGNANSLIARVTLDTSDGLVSPFFNSENFNIIVSENVINNGEITNNNITILTGGNHSNAANIVVTISDSDLYPGERATANVRPSGLVSSNVVAINVINPGRGYVKSPTITISEPGASTNATAAIISEDRKFGGNALARYITRKITLADGFDSGDLRVTLRAIRPQGTNIMVYYKALSASDPQNFSDLNWQLMFLENNQISPDLITPIDFVYRPTSNLTENRLFYTQDDILYPLGGTFKYFAIKIVMLAECGCVPPVIRHMRAIALPGG